MDAFAAEVMEKEEIAIQLRLLQTLAQIGTEKNTTLILPVPVDLLANLFRRPPETGGCANCARVERGC